MIIKTCNKNTFDLFLGEGWENWSRWKIKFGKPAHSGLAGTPNQLFQVKGTRIPKADLIQLQETYNAK